MKGMLFPAFVAVMLGGLGAAHADPKSYCEAYARDAATARLSGSAILTGVRTPVSPEEWAKANSGILADCLAAYQHEPVPAKPVTVATTAAPAAVAAPDLKAGSPEWKDYCAKKYVSFNPDTGMYQSMSGKQRPCLVTKD